MVRLGIPLKAKEIYRLDTTTVISRELDIIVIAFSWDDVGEEIKFEYLVVEDALKHTWCIFKSNLSNLYPLSTGIDAPYTVEDFLPYYSSQGVDIVTNK